MDAAVFALNLIEYILLAYFGFAALYVFTFSVAGRFSAKRLSSVLKKQRRIAVLIPGFKEDNVIVEVARRALEQSYPSDLFEVVIIADSFQELTLHADRSANAGNGKEGGQLYAAWEKIRIGHFRECETLSPV